MNNNYNNFYNEYFEYQPETQKGLPRVSTINMAGNDRMATAMLHTQRHNARKEAFQPNPISMASPIGDQVFHSSPWLNVTKQKTMRIHHRLR